MRSARPAAWLSFALCLLVVSVTRILVGQGFSLAAQEPPVPLGPVAIPTRRSRRPDGTAPVAWRTSRFSGQTEFAFDGPVAHTGQRGVRITSARGADAAWSVVVALKPDSTYRLTAFVKTDHARRATMRRGQLPRPGLTAARIVLIICTKRSKRR